MKDKGLVLGLLLAMFAVGCGHQQTEPVTAENEQTKAEEETTTPTAKAETEAEASKAADKEEEALNEITGTIKSFTGGYLYLQADDGSGTLEFNLSEAQLDCKNGILSGDQVTVFYEGEIKGWDTSKVQVSHITDQVDKEELKPETLIGTVADVTTNTLSIRKDDQDTISFISTGADVQFSNGLELGSWVEVTYLGKLQGNNAKNVKVVSITDDDDAIAEKQAEITLTPFKRTVYAAADICIHEDYCADSPVLATLSAGTELNLTAGIGFGWVQTQYKGIEGYVYEEYLAETGQESSGSGNPELEWDQEEKEMTAELLKVDQDLIVVKSEDGKQYEFSCADTSISMKYGLLEGSEIVLEYLGQASADEETASLLSMTDVDPKVVNEKTGGFSVVGTVMASGANAMTIMSDDGAQITFTTEEITTEEEDMPGEGAYVSVVVKPCQESNVYKALSIENVY